MAVRRAVPPFLPAVSAIWVTASRLSRERASITAAVKAVQGQLGADEAATMVAVTTNSEVNALATHLAHDAFGFHGPFDAALNLDALDPFLEKPGRRALEQALEEPLDRLERPVLGARWAAVELVDAGDRRRGARKARKPRRSGGSRRGHPGWQR
mgnify:CR=1 FL=1